MAGLKRAGPSDRSFGLLIGLALAAVAARAVPLGQRDVGALLWSLRAPIAGFARRACATETLDDLASSALVCEIDAMRHSALDARLFAS